MRTRLHETFEVHPKNLNKNPILNLLEAESVSSWSSFIQSGYSTDTELSNRTWAIHVNGHLCMIVFPVDVFFIFHAVDETSSAFKTKNLLHFSRLFLLSVIPLPSCHLCRKPQVTFDLRLNRSLAVDPVLRWRSWPVSGSFSNTDA